MEADLFFAIINAVSDYLSDYSLEFPRIIEKSEVDLDEFSLQPSDCKFMNFEYVKQSGGGMSGDFYSGTILFPLTEGRFLSVDYTC
jgi:hypothetical protein